MNIALVGPVYPYRGGIAHHTMMLAHALAPRHNLLTISFKRQYPGWLYPGRTDKDPSRQPLRVEAEYLLDPFNPLTWWNTAERISRFEPQIVVIQWWTTFWAVGFGVLARLLRRKSVRVGFLIHNVVPHEHHALDGPLARYALTAGDRYIVQSNHERASLLAMLPHAPVCLSRFPLYDMVGGPQVSALEARARLGLPTDAPVILFFGLVRPHKGLKYLIDAIAELRDGGVAVTLVIAGEFWEDEQSYRRHIEQRDLCACTFIFNYYVPDEMVSSFMSACDVMVAPYLTGTQSAAVSLAARYGVNIVKTTPLDDGEPGDTGPRADWIVAPADVRGLASGIRNALNFAGPESPNAVNSGWDDLVGVIEAAAAKDAVPRPASP